MAVLIIGAGLVGSQIARILVEQGETPVLMDRAAQPKALGEIVDLARVELDQGEVPADRDFELVWEPAADQAPLAALLAVLLAVGGALMNAWSKRSSR